MKIFILGTGRMGAWLSEELCWDHEVWVHDADPYKMKYFMKVHRILDLEELDSVGPELFINCVPLGHTIEAFDRVIPHLPETCMLADIASVKNGLEDYYRKTGRPFVSSHPMFGPTGANIRDLHDESAIIITESCEKGKEFFRELYRRLKIHIFDYSFEEHDKTVAYSLATPFASSMVFAACMKKQDAPGTNFKKHMAVATGMLSEDDRLLTEIMFNTYTIRQLELINSKLAYLTHIIRQRDYEEMKKFLDTLRANIAN
ncbi:MAG TPA: prephenate dehydrogenase/arogenate dehydrogenase family protein [Spirochaetaceae bacterium]|nr:prephenate dehydrogenase/arogenate dehydrogenase family protein [Spirochaetaceae bacterium]